MNAPERIVETYYRMVKHCFTMPDVKVIAGNNRQIDLLVFCPASNLYYHVETAVTHVRHWNYSESELAREVNFKFFGAPRQQDTANPRTDAARGKTYLQPIKDTYVSCGVDFESVVRVMCGWEFSDGAAQTVWRDSSAREFPPDRLELLSFRDQVIPQLKAVVGPANYDDDILRTLSLLTQYEEQSREQAGFPRSS